MTTICGTRRDSCNCKLPNGHADSHECSCGIGWMNMKTMKDPDLPDPDWRGIDTTMDTPCGNCGKSRGQHSADSGFCHRDANKKWLEDGPKFAPIRKKSEPIPIHEHPLPANPLDDIPAPDNTELQLAMVKALRLASKYQEES